MRISLVRDSRWVALLVSGLLVACGGGGGGGGGGDTSFAPLAINESNSGQVASEAYAAGNLAGSGATTTTDMVTFSVGSASSPAFDLRSFATNYLERVRQRGSSQMVTAQQVWQDPWDCGGGGTLVDTWNDADNNLVDSAGDSYSTTYNNCIEGGVTLNGGVSATLGTLVGDTFGDYQISGSFSFDNFSISYSGYSASINGSMTYSASRVGPNVSVNLQIPSLTASDPSGSSIISGATFEYSYNENTLAYSYSFTATLAGTSIGGQVTVATIAPFQGTGAGHPVSGSMRITGAGNSSVTVTATGGGNVRLDVDSNGDGVIESTTFTTWAALESL